MIVGKYWCDTTARLKRPPGSRGVRESESFPRLLMDTRPTDVGMDVGLGCLPRVWGDSPEVVFGAEPNPSVVAHCDCVRWRQPR